jgi:glucose uptake protein GlcU
MLAATSLGVAISYPIMQSGLFVAGLWGVLLFGELRAPSAHALYWPGGAALLGGVALLARAGGGGGAGR